MHKTDQPAFPAGFLWGTAISAHQSEGNNVNSDAWLCENVTPSVYVAPSLDACDSYHRFEEDIAIAADLGLNCYRVGIEWARIEPEPGCFSSAELDRYRQLLEACHARGLAPMVTYNHFTVPRWFAARGGFEVADGADLFANFAERATARLGDLISYATTFNEANIQRLISMVFQTDKRQAAMLAACAKASGSERFSSLLFADAAKTEPVLVDAHRKATAAIKASAGDFPVGLTLTMQDVQGVGENNLSEHVIQALYGPWLDEAANSDFIGVQTYTRVLIGPAGRLDPPADAEMTAAGYEFYPQALGGTIRFAAQRTGRPVFVTENGIATNDDARRIAYIDAAVSEVQDCLAEGIDVRSYIHWSLLDNFEWTSGYGQHFGLVEVDFNTFKRTPKPSALHLGAIAMKGK
ncbi:MAG: glycoside hydrolase family 1 [Collimonas fungivorans]|uniref:glycoside hydrolase family 1 protein n=1 Tax=Collimonas fungivorans TaxID=158899 RepID=UPI0026EF6AB1|nr:family 1 glycosylhydrolase [Collimonas fungivorans]MDB5769289.1 glycoside hydrolase family 1 [Collimonas fungivorans]